MSLPSVSLAAPAYNEAASLQQVIESWLVYLKGASFLSDYEIVVCNDGSKDETGSILAQLAQQDPHVKPVHLARNQGAAAALTAAIANTRMEWVLLLDSDGQFPVDRLEAMLQVTANGAQAVIGVRQKKEDSLFTRFGTAASAALCNLFFGTKLADFNSAFKLVSGPLLRSLTLEAKGLNYSTDVTGKLLERGVSLHELAVFHRPRIGGKSSMRALRDSAHRLLFVLYLGFRQFLFRTGVLQRPGDPK